MKHPDVALSADGKGEVFRHGEITDAAFTITAEEAFRPDKEKAEGPAAETGYVLMSEEDIEKEIAEEEKQNEEKKEE